MTRPRRVVRPVPAAVRLLVLLVVAASALVLGLAPARADSPTPARGVWPLSPRPRVMAGFDPPSTRYGAGHRGVDLLGRVGQPVHTALAGRVTFAERLAGRGVVVVDHGATRTTYEPVAASVHVGDRLTEGAAIGRLELFGSHCLPAACLHWGLIAGHDHYLDPLTLVGAAPVRLLPLDGAARSFLMWQPPASASTAPLRMPPATGDLRAVPPGSSQARGWAWR